jgi:hypothetical protein
MKLLLIPVTLNEHEAGDTYTCEYSCPGGFYTKRHDEAISANRRIQQFMETVCSGGDLSKLLAGATKHSGEFTYFDDIAKFRLEAKYDKCNDN